MQAKTIIGFINETLKGQRLVFGEVTAHRAKQIIRAIIGDLPAFSPVTQEVIDYCEKHYNISP